MRSIHLLLAAVLLGQTSAGSAQYDPQTATVEMWYRAYLGRTSLTDPWSGGWVNLLRQGHSYQSVLAAILGSDEYYLRNGGTMPAFLQALARDALRRPLSAGEYNFWLRRAYTQSRQEIAHEMLTQNSGSGAYTPPPPSAPPGWPPGWDRDRWQHQERHDYRRPYYPYRPYQR